MIIDAMMISGYVGAILSLIAFLLSSLGRLSRSTYAYMALNGIGATFLIYYAYLSKTWIFAFLNVIWGGVEVYYLYKKLADKPIKRNHKR
jgi:hypothetical protein